MIKTTFNVSKMDCGAEEGLVRMSLDGIPAIKHLDFDLTKRQVTIFHNGGLELIEEKIAALDLGGSLMTTEETDQIDFETDKGQRHLLRTVLAINFGFFVVEMAFGLISSSMGLVADSLDMLADSLVYSVSLFAVGATVVRKKGIARAAGYFQITLAILGFIEVIRRFLGSEEMPDFGTMIVVSVLALTANAFCLYLFQRSKSEDAHMQASAIFTSNDVIINFGVIIAGVLVYLLNSNKPDLIVGTIVFVVVLRGALKILRLAK
ncbi:MAG TPA: cation transporter [Pyrinomonadaceae bacterium]|nr:cation transporter [Pyrinomonadaceae bacterium]